MGRFVGSGWCVLPWRHALTLLSCCGTDSCPSAGRSLSLLFCRYLSVSRCCGSKHVPCTRLAAWPSYHCGVAGLLPSFWCGHVCCTRVLQRVLYTAVLHCTLSSPGAATYCLGSFWVGFDALSATTFGIVGCRCKISTLAGIDTCHRRTLLAEQQAVCSQAFSIRSTVGLVPAYAALL
jgi:hypothetical protein